MVKSVVPGGNQEYNSSLDGSSNANQKVIKYEACITKKEFSQKSNTISMNNLSNFVITYIRPCLSEF